MHACSGCFVVGEESLIEFEYCSAELTGWDVNADHHDVDVVDGDKVCDIVFFSQFLAYYSIHHIIPEIKQLPTDISLNFQICALQSMERGMSSVISKTKEQETNLDTAVISSRALEEH